jgi:hypothetical protein
LPSFDEVWQERLALISESVMVTDWSARSKASMAFARFFKSLRRNILTGKHEGIENENVG